MPNGNPHFDQEQHPLSERFFAPIAAVLERFASDHHLRLNKYYHQNAAWSFVFRHPRGGLGKIHVLKWGKESVIIHGMWWIDDRQRSTRSSRDRRFAKLNLKDPALREKLDECLGKILSWPLGEWARVDSIDAWRRLTPEERATMETYEQEYPFPKLDPEEHE